MRNLRIKEWSIQYFIKVRCLYLKEMRKQTSNLCNSNCKFSDNEKKPSNNQDILWCSLKKNGLIFLHYFLFSDKFFSKRIKNKSLSMLTGDKSKGIKGSFCTEKKHVLFNLINLCLIFFRYKPCYFVMERDRIQDFVWAYKKYLHIFYMHMTKA